jgi:hypothetical protein
MRLHWDWDVLWTFLLFEVLLALFPLIVAGWVSVYLNWTSWVLFVGEGDLLPWALPISAIALRRAAPSAPGLFMLALFVLLLCMGVYIASCYIRYKLPRRQIEIHRMRLAQSSIYLSIITLFVGGWAALL